MTRTLSNSGTSAKSAPSQSSDEAPYRFNGWRLVIVAVLWLGLALVVPSNSITGFSIAGVVVLIFASFLKPSR